MPFVQELLHRRRSSGSFQQSDYSPVSPRWPVGRRLKTPQFLISSRDQRIQPSSQDPPSATNFVFGNMVGTIDPQNSRERHETRARSERPICPKCHKPMRLLVVTGDRPRTVALHRLRRRGSAALARCRQVARSRATTAVKASAADIGIHACGSKTTMRCCRLRRAGRNAAEPPANKHSSRRTTRAVSPAFRKRGAAGAALGSDPVCGIIFRLVRMASG
jgi:hypothetical protein